MFMVSEWKLPGCWGLLMAHLSSRYVEGIFVGDEGDRRERLVCDIVWCWRDQSHILIFTETCSTNLLIVGCRFIHWHVDKLQAPVVSGKRVQDLSAELWNLMGRPFPEWWICWCFAFTILAKLAVNPLETRVRYYAESTWSRRYWRYQHFLLCYSLFIAIRFCQFETCAWRRLEDGSSLEKPKNVSWLAAVSAQGKHEEKRMVKAPHPKAGRISTFRWASPRLSPTPNWIALGSRSSVWITIRIVGKMNHLTFWKVGISLETSTREAWLMMWLSTVHGMQGFGSDLLVHVFHLLLDMQNWLKKNAICLLLCEFQVFAAEMHLFSDPWSPTAGCISWSAFFVAMFIFDQFPQPWVPKREDQKVAMENQWK